VVRTPHREEVMAELAAAGIETGIHYPVPCHLQEPYREFARGALPVAEQAAREILSLPMFPHLTADQVSFVCDALHTSRAVSAR
jgi:dTDP-4-amino-4,6-dideoxygalactose transaminase